MKTVLAVGIPVSLASSLSSALPGTPVQVASNPLEALERLRSGAVSALIIEDSFPDASAREVLAAEWNRRPAARIPIFYCLERGAERGLSREEAESLGITQLFFHPIDDAELVRQLRHHLGIPTAVTPRPPIDRASMASAMEALWDRFKDTVLGRVTVVEDVALAVLDGTLDMEGRRAGEREAHKLAGSVGTFGFMEASRYARELEGILAGDAPLGSAEALRLSDLAVALRRELERPPAEKAAPAETGEPQTYLLIADSDAEAAERYAMEASGRTLRAEIARDLGRARELIATHPPDVVLLDPALSEDFAEGLAFLEELSNRTPPVPVVVLTAHNSFSLRVDVARFGGRVFLQKPLAPVRVVDAIEEVLSRTSRRNGKVLAVDDDPSVLAAVRTLLEPKGVAVETLGDPLRFWEALERTGPDVVILDVDMPHLTGIELCRVVRSDPRWSSLPVLFLTARNDVETIERIFAGGADDYVTKPLVGPELVTRITNRLERSQLQRNLAETDSLTGTANRRKSEEVMTHFLRLAARQRQAFSLAVVDLDLFKGINDQYGHAMGDEVLRRVSKVLLRSFRAEDIVSRWGGEEFVIGMYGALKDDGVARLVYTLDAVRQEEFIAPDGESFNVTFSAGVAHYPGDGTELHTLYRAADQALYVAKEAGRNRVLPAGWAPDHPDPATTVDVVLVEDDETLATLLLHALDVRGYRTRWIPDGQAAADALTGARPALRSRVVILDVDLPGLDGYALLGALGRSGVLDRTRVIMLTARSHEDEVVNALEQGAFDHVAKPFSVPILLQRIRRALRP